jgi:hypothetical protein
MRTLLGYIVNNKIIAVNQEVLRRLKMMTKIYEVKFSMDEVQLVYIYMVNLKQDGKFCVSSFVIRLIGMIQKCLT